MLGKCRFVIVCRFCEDRNGGHGTCGEKWQDYDHQFNWVNMMDEKSRSPLFPTKVGWEW